MASCNDCLHVDVCRGIYLAIISGEINSYEEFLEKCEKEHFEKQDISPCNCLFYKDRSRFVELPFPISEGTKLRYIFEDESGRIRAGEDWETVTRVCKDGFYVSGRLKSMIEKYHCNGCDNYNGAKCSACCVDDCFRYIDDIPTIIEAEVSE